MCFGGNRNSDREAAERRHQEQMDLQREQMRIQQEQFEKNLEAQRQRFEEQQAAATAQAPVAPEPIAEVAASATEVADNATTQEGAASMMQIGGNPLITNKAGSGRRKFRTDIIPGGGGSGALQIPNT